MPTTEEKAQRQLEQAMLISQHKVVIPYPNVLTCIDADLQGLTLRKRQVVRLKKYTRRQQTERHRHAEEIHRAREDTSGTHEHDEEDELLRGNTRALRGQSKIVAEGRRQREEALRQ